MRAAVIAIAGAALLTGFASPASAQKGILDYHETVDIAANGSARFSIEASVAGLTGDTLELPLNFSNARDVAVESPGGAASARVTRVGDTNLIVVKFNQLPTAKTELKISFMTDKFFDWTRAKSKRGIYGFSYTFTNTTAVTVNNYALKVVTPPGFDMTGVTNSTPRATGEEVVSPYDFATEGGRLVVNLRSRTVPPGRTAAIAFGFEPSESNPLPAIAIGVLIALFGLYLKRDVLTRPDYVREVSG
jgi:hypothetical protein